MLSPVPPPSAVLRSLARRYSSTRKRPLVKQKHEALYSAHVRPWERLSMGDVFQLVRQIELNYGRIQEFKCFRDYEIKSRFQQLMFVSFVSPASVTRISRGGDVLRVNVNKEAQPGGPGLDEIMRSIRQDDDSTPPFLPREDPAYASHQRTVSCRISAATHNHFTIASERQPIEVKAQYQALGREFLSWAGFRPVEDIPLGEDSTMRKALRKWSTLTGRPEPGAAPRHPPERAAPPMRPASLVSSLKGTRPIPQKWQPIANTPPAQRSLNPLDDPTDALLGPILSATSADTEPVSISDSSSARIPLRRPRPSEAQSPTQTETWQQISSIPVGPFHADTPLDSLVPGPQSRLPDSLYASNSEADTMSSSKTEARERPARRRSRSTPHGGTGL